MTPGCTTQAVDFTAAAGDLAEAGLDVIGVSPDPPEKLLRFREEEGLRITLVSDPDKQVLAAYGAYGTKKLYGKEVVGVIRSTFVVDAEGPHREGRLQRQGHRARGQAAPRPRPGLRAPASHRPGSQDVPTGPRLRPASAGPRLAPGPYGPSSQGKCPVRVRPGELERRHRVLRRPLVEAVGAQHHLTGVG
jgi:hypothetical protein